MAIKHVLALAIATVVATAAAQPVYTAIDLGTFGGNHARPTDLNNRGHVVGGIDYDQNSRGFMWDGELHLLSDDRSSGAIGINNAGTVVGHLNSRPTAWTDGVPTTFSDLVGAARDVNEGGTIVGFARFDGSDERPFVYRDGDLIDLGTLGGRRGQARSINEQGQVVGVTQNAGSGYNAFLWEGDELINLGSLGGISATAFEINDAGVIAGEAMLPNFEYRPVIWQDGEIINLGTLGGDTGSATGINNRGEVVGIARDHEGDMKPFLWSEIHGMLELQSLVDNTLDVQLTTVYCINDFGWIAAYGTAPDGSTHAVLLIPGPGTVAIMLLGAVPCVRRRRRTP